MDNGSSISSISRLEAAVSTRPDWWGLILLDCNLRCQRIGVSGEIFAGKHRDFPNQKPGISCKISDFISDRLDGFTNHSSPIQQLSGGPQWILRSAKDGDTFSKIPVSLWSLCPSGRWRWEMLSPSCTRTSWAWLGSSSSCWGTCWASRKRRKRRQTAQRCYNNELDDMGNSASLIGIKFGGLSWEWRWSIFTSHGIIELDWWMFNESMK